ncbi:MAG TPA: ribbon-helix-helix protein, CopG family [Rhodospirillales bacterium]|nr:ribbon-helix-helix protein, CopG family [Rhodospirillales bacterium]
MVHPLTVRLNETDISKLDEIAKATDRKRSWHMTQAIQAYIKDEYTFLEGVRRGIDAADRGDVVSHESVEADLEALLSKQGA